MKAHRFTVSVLGRTLLDVHLGELADPPASPVDAAPTGEIGAVTDRRTTANLGFAAAATSLPRDRRPVVR